MGVVRNISKWYFSKNALPYWCVFVMDCTIVALCTFLTYYIQFGAGILISSFWPRVYGLIISLFIYALMFRAFRTYSGIVRFSSFVDLQRISFALVSGAVLSYVLNLLLVHFGVNSVIMPSLTGTGIILIFSTVLMWASRVLVKTLYDVSRVSSQAQRTFIYGVKAGAVSLAKNIRNQDKVIYDLKGFVNPDTSENVAILMGLKIYPDDENLVEVMKDNSIEVLFVSPLQTDHFRDRQDLISELIENNIKIKMMPEAEEWDGKSELQHEQLRAVEVEDLLPREKIEVDMDAIGAMLKGRSILITGAAGSIGSEMVRQVAVYSPAKMVLVDQAETPMHDIRLMMKNRFPQISCETVVTSICNQHHMEKLFAEYRPDYVFHAAAYKHVPMMEDNPAMAVQNNVAGTRIIADTAIKYGTRKFVMISTDKAVNPTNVMGCSKRICEIYCQALNKAVVEGTAPTQIDGSPAVTQFVTTRFGNVLGSNGSVIPIFREQIRNGGPITVTHPDIIRFFMLIPEACKLVLEAGTMGKGGEIFVFDMGKPVRIVDLAKRMIQLSGAKHIEIKFTGLRDGEKLYEEVLNDAEVTKKTPHPKIMVAAVREYDYATACANEERLLESSYSFDDMGIVKIMKEIVPEYKSKCSKYEALD